jgi:hypothetical protein
MAGSSRAILSRSFMDPHLNEALTDAVRRWARPTTPDELKRRGVSRVRSLSLSRVAALIEKAVNRTMIARTLGDYPEDTGEFSAHAGREFLAMLRGDDDQVRESREQVERQARGTLDKLKDELAERRAAVAKQRLALARIDGAVGEGDDALAHKLRKLFAAWGGSAENPSPLEREVIELAVSELRRERAAGSASRLDEQAKSMQLLERRIAKLGQLLGETEEKLVLARRQASADQGVASIYDEVQGLDEEDASFTKKAELMASIFAANLTMRDELESAVLG